MLRRRMDVQEQRTASGYRQNLVARRTCLREKMVWKGRWEYEKEIRWQKAGAL